MKKVFCYLLIAMLILGTFAGCKKQDTPHTESTGTNQTENTGTVQTESTGTEQTDNTETIQAETTEVTQPENTEETKTESEKENPYAIREITDYRVKIKDNQKFYNDYSFFSLSFPADWKCLEQQGEDGRNHYFRDPVLDEKCQLSIRLTGAVYAKERTPEQYRESLLSRSLQDLVIDSITEETVQGYKCMKVVYSYTENDTKFIKVLYNNLIKEPRLYNFSIIFPADQKDIYEPIFAAIMDSVVIK